MQISMIPRGQSLRQLWFAWPGPRFGRFNFQREEDVEELAALLASPTAPAVVVLGGERGSGRSYLCEVAAERARERGLAVALWQLDLAGFDPDADHALADYLQHLEKQQAARQTETREKAKGAVQSVLQGLLNLAGNVSEVTAALVSLLHEFSEPLERFAELLSQPASGSVPLRDDPDALHRFLAKLTEGRKLLVHVQDGPLLSSELRRWLIREAERAPDRLLLVISCPPGQETGQVAPEALTPPARLDLRPLLFNELRQLIDLRFAPNEFPDELVTALLRRGHGRSAAIANLLADLMEEELLPYGEDGVYRLPPEGLADPKLVAQLARSFFDEVDRPLVTLRAEDPELGKALYEMLFLASLCGRYVPMAAILEFLKLDEEQTAAAFEFIDDVLADELGWLVDEGFRVPGFGGGKKANVYTFFHPLFAQVLLDHQKEGLEREMRAIGLLRFLEQHLPTLRRGWARCLLAIAEHLGEREREPYAKSLAWWVSLEAADALGKEVAADLRQGRVKPEMVWKIARESETWPAHRRLALLDAYSDMVLGQGETAPLMPVDQLAEFHILRGELLLHLGRYPAALAEGLEALRLGGSKVSVRGSGLAVTGLARLWSGDAQAAKIDLEKCVALGVEQFGGEHQGTLTAINNLAMAHKVLGEFDVARALFQQALVGVLGAKHPGALKSMSNLAEVLHDQGDLDGAQAMHQQVLDHRHRVLGAEHPGTLNSMNNLAEVLHVQGDLDGARALHQQALEGQRRVLGDEHPNTLISMNNLAQVLHDLKDLDGARALHQQALEGHRRVLGEDHPHTLVSMKNLAAVLDALGDLEGAQKLRDLAQQLSKEP